MALIIRSEKIIAVFESNLNRYRKYECEID